MRKTNREADSSSNSEVREEHESPAIIDCAQNHEITPEDNDGSESEMITEKIEVSINDESRHEANDISDSGQNDEHELPIIVDCAQDPELVLSDDASITDEN